MDTIKRTYRVPLVLEPQPEGGFVVTSPALPELITDGDTVDEALANVRDAIAAVLEIYEDQGRAFPPSLLVSESGPLTVDYLAVG